MNKNAEQLLGRAIIVVLQDFQQLFGSRSSWAGQDVFWDSCTEGSGLPYPCQRAQLLDLLLPSSSSQNFSDSGKGTTEGEGERGLTMESIAHGGYPVAGITASGQLMECRMTD